MSGCIIPLLMYGWPAHRRRRVWFPRWVVDRQIGDKEVTQAFSRLAWMLDPSCVLVGASCDEDYVCDSWLTCR